MTRYLFIMYDLKKVMIEAKLMLSALVKILQVNIEFQNDKPKDFHLLHAAESL